eukprot:7098631-Prymnesium_polylepis.1
MRLIVPPVQCAAIYEFLSQPAAAHTQLWNPSTALDANRMHPHGVPECVHHDVNLNGKEHAQRGETKEDEEQINACTTRLRAVLNGVC